MVCGIGRDVYIVKVGNVNLVFRNYESLSDIMGLIDEQGLEGPVTIEKALATTYRSE